MSLQDVVTLFDDIFKTLKVHALARHFERSPTVKISEEQAFAKLYGLDPQFRSTVAKAQRLQSEFAETC